MAGSFHKQAWFLVIGLVTAVLGLFALSAFRDLFDSILQASVPMGEKHVNGGWSLVAYRTCYFILVLALLFIVAVLVV